MAQSNDELAMLSVQTVPPVPQRHPVAMVTKSNRMASRICTPLLLEGAAAATAPRECEARSSYDRRRGAKEKSISHLSIRTRASMQVSADAPSRFCFIVDVDSRAR